METTKRQLTGVVVGDRMTKTRVVEVSRIALFKKYEKRIPRRMRVKCHDEKNEYRVGDMVVIDETRPLSKGKRWVLTGKLESKK